MDYTKQNFVDGQVLTAECLNHMETGIKSACDATPPACNATDCSKVLSYGENGLEWVDAPMELVIVYYYADADNFNFDYNELRQAYTDGKIVAVDVVFPGGTSTIQRYICIEDDFGNDRLVFTSQGSDSVDALYLKKDGTFEESHLSLADIGGGDIGDIESALDSIISIQNSLIGGDGV